MKTCLALTALLALAACGADPTLDNSATTDSEAVYIEKDLKETCKDYCTLVDGVDSCPNKMALECGIMVSLPFGSHPSCMDFCVRQPEEHIAAEVACLGENPSAQTCLDCFGIPVVCSPVTGI